MSDQDVKRYIDAMHAIQTGVATEQENGSDDGTPKHLRVGIAAGQITTSVLAAVLIEKGLLTLDEYQALLADEAERMVGEYEHRINQFYGVEGVVHLK